MSEDFSCKIVHFGKMGSKRVVSLPGNYLSNQKLNILLLYENWSNLINVDFNSQKKSLVMRFISCVQTLSTSPIYKIN